MKNQRRDCIFTILAGVLFILRGLQLQCIYPPLEGPDEYQHIAYLTYVEETGHIPRYYEAIVPKSLYPYLLVNPHCEYDWMQTRTLGCLQYKDFYQKQAVQTGDPDIPLYQAQHPPLYYVLASPVFACVRDRFGFHAAVYTLRIINLLLATIAMIFLLSPIKSIFQSARSRWLSILAISLSPMFLVHVSRVANDALALVFAGLAVYMLTRMSNQRRLVSKAAIIGGFVGIGVMTKMTVLCILPAAVVYFWYLALISRMSYCKAVLCSAAAIGCYLIFTIQYHLHSYQAFGTPFPSQETINNIVQNKTFADTIAAIRFENIYVLFVNVLVRQNLWLSGWSYLGPKEVFSRLYDWTLLISFLGLVPYIIFAIRRRASGKQLINAHIALCLLVIFFSSAAAYAHALSSILAYGAILTQSYYFMIAYPAFLICVLAAAGGYGKWGTPAAASVLAVLFLVTEYHSLLGKAVQHWTDATDYQVIFDRLASVHPVFPGPYFFFPLAIIVCLLTAALMFKGLFVEHTKPMAESRLRETEFASNHHN